jgi:hypothetical protein
MPVITALLRHPPRKHSRFAKIFAPLSTLSSLFGLVAVLNVNGEVDQLLMLTQKRAVGGGRLRVMSDSADNRREFSCTHLPDEFPAGAISSIRRAWLSADANAEKPV